MIGATSLEYITVAAEVAPDDSSDRKTPNAANAQRRQKPNAYFITKLLGQVKTRFPHMESGHASARLCPFCDAGACAGITKWTKSRLAPIVYNVNVITVIPLIFRSQHRHTLSERPKSARQHPAIGRAARRVHSGDE